MLNRNQRKRQFLQWLLHHFKHNDPVVNHFLQFLMTEPNGIQYVSFTESCDYTPRGIYISYLTHTDKPFVYYKNHRQFQLCEQAFHDFRLNMQITKEQFYIEIDIPRIYAVLYEFNIFEENPYLPVEEDRLVEAEAWLDALAQNTQIKVWREKIDEGLAAHNYEQVEYYLQLIEKTKGDTNEN